MNQDIQDFLLHALDRLGAIYRELTAANRDFLGGLPSAGRLMPLLDQREVSFAESRDLEEEMLATCREAQPGMAGKALPELLPGLEREIPAAAPVIRRLREALTDLVATDRQIQEVLATSKEALEAEIKKIRRGASLLKGYLQPDETGSCFIDRVK